MKKLASTALVAAVLGGGLLATMSAQRQSAARPLTIYFIDTEGGQSTLIVTPAGQSLLVDAGYAGAGIWSGARNAIDASIMSSPGDPAFSRDPQRIARAAREAGVTAIDDLLITHFHADHDGGVTELSQIFPIRTFLDRGSPSADLDQNPFPGALAAFKWYSDIRAKGSHVVVKTGDRLPLTGVDAIVVSTAGLIIQDPLPGAGATNPACGPGTFLPDNNENPKSIGFRLQFGKFRFAQLGDLSGPPLSGLFCPRDLLGTLDVYQSPHHANADGLANPGALGAIAPRVVVTDNGSIKGGAVESLAALHAARGIEDVWQLHQSMLQGAQNFAEDRIANLGQIHTNTPSSIAYWIKVTAREDGSFTVTNSRTGASKEYAAR